MTEPTPIPFETFKETVDAGDTVPEKYRGEGIVLLTIDHPDVEPLGAIRPHNYMTAIQESLDLDPDEDVPHHINVDADRTTVIRTDVRVSDIASSDAFEGYAEEGAESNRQQEIATLAAQNPSATVEEIAHKRDASVLFTRKILDTVAEQYH